MAPSYDEVKTTLDKQAYYEKVFTTMSESELALGEEDQVTITNQLVIIIPIINDNKRRCKEIAKSTFVKKGEDGKSNPEGYDDIKDDYEVVVRGLQDLIEPYMICLDILGLME